MERTPKKKKRRKKKESAHKVNSGEENCPAAPAGIRTRDLSITSPALLPTIELSRLNGIKTTIKSNVAPNVRTALQQVNFNITPYWFSNRIGSE